MEVIIKDESDFELQGKEERSSERWRHARIIEHNKKPSSVKIKEVDDLHLFNEKIEVCPDEPFEVKVELIEEELLLNEVDNRDCKGLELEVKKESDPECCSFEKIEDHCIEVSSSMNEGVSDPQHSNDTTVGCVERPVDVKDEIMPEETQLTDVDDEIDKPGVELGVSGNNRQCWNYECIENSFIEPPKIEEIDDPQHGNEISLGFVERSADVKDELMQEELQLTDVDGGVDFPESFLKNEREVTVMEEMQSSDNASNHPVRGSMSEHTLARINSCTLRGIAPASGDASVKHSLAYKHHCTSCRVNFCSKQALIEHDRAYHKHLCTVCSEWCSSKEELMKHNSLCPCIYCNRKFCSKEALVKHRQAGKDHCTSCDVTFCSKQAFIEHVRAYHKYLCAFCSELCFSKEQLVKHNSMYLCIFCDGMFCSKQALVKHRQAGKDHCTSCDVKFCSKQALIEHDRAYHKHLCTVCSEWCSSKEELMKHNSLYPCIYCYRKFCSKEALVKHRRAGKDHCTSCDVKFCSKQALIEHVRAYHKHLCLFCSEWYFSKEELMKHNSMYPCIYCDRKFCSKLALVRHRQAGKDHCISCDVKFCSKKALIEHVKAYHKHPCTFCSEWRFSKEELMKHNSMYPCIYCDEKFCSKQALKKHRQAGKYLCSLCRKIFCSGKELNNHSKKHHYCTLCENEFPTQNEFNLHICPHPDGNRKGESLVERYLNGK